MNSNLDEKTSKTCWFVGATYGSDDQKPRFLREGIWENGYTDRYLELVKSARPGERIAIKASYTRKHGLPFDNRGRSVSIMGIKAIGVITENLGDGRTLKVRWETVEPQREWYFYTVMKMIWRVSPDIAKMVQNESLAHRCRSLAMGLGRLGVSGACPTHHEIITDVIARHHAGDRPMMDAAHLAFNLALPTEMAGDKLLPLPDRDIFWLRRLYEKAVAGFYRVALNSPPWRIEAGKWLKWPIAQASGNIEKIFPAMQTDIILENQAEKRRLIIDTKFNALLTKGRHREESLRSGYLYQIYAYLRSQEKEEDALSRHATGLLLHPAIHCAIDKYVVMQGHEIRFATVDLSASAGEIRQRLLAVIK